MMLWSPWKMYKKYTLVYTNTPGGGYFVFGFLMEQIRVVYKWINFKYFW